MAALKIALVMGINGTQHLPFDSFPLLYTRNTQEQEAILMPNADNWMLDMHIPMFVVPRE